MFAPELANGLILYNDQLTKGSVGDFISFGMSDGFAEFRYVTLSSKQCHYKEPLVTFQINLALIQIVVVVFYLTSNLSLSATFKFVKEIKTT